MAYLDNNLWGDAKADVDAYIQGLIDSEAFGSITYAITWGDRKIASEGFGRADTSDESDGSAPDDNTVYRVGSLTKTFTTALFYSLWQDGLVHLDDRPGDLWPSFSFVNPYDSQSDYNPITWESLTSHTAGILTSNICHQQIPGGCDLTTEQVLASIQDVSTIQYAPFTNPEYSNFGFAALGRLLETPSILGDLTYYGGLAERVLEPLGLKFGFEKTDPLFEGLNFATTGSSHDWDSLGWLDPAGGAYSTASDIAEYLIWMMDDKTDTVMQPSTKRMMLRPQYVFESGRETMAAGWDQAFRHGTWVYDKSGELPPYFSNTQFVPSMKMGVTILTHDEKGGVSAGEVCAEVTDKIIHILDALAGMYGPGDTIPIEGSIDKYLGNYGGTDPRSGEDLSVVTLAESTTVPGTIEVTVTANGQHLGLLSAMDTYDGVQMDNVLRYRQPNVGQSCYVLRFSGSQDQMATFRTDDEGNVTHVMFPNATFLWARKL
ncbi:hypothetical protein KIPB_007818 [Kipferlia bialata]|uniref:Beta-lactamase-related domain-containing protein n=1 Tax=Kipferlia bialata TaxID=797122 RepID=A0A9K3CZ59_9EUKA|nr:hypothetical protein KIPB_007818 [Kipferlia bialata]|eukprot:g7818.t1